MQKAKTKIEAINLWSYEWALFPSVGGDHCCWLLWWCWKPDLATTAAATVWTNTPNCELSWLLRKTDSQFWFHPWIIITCTGFKMIQKYPWKASIPFTTPFQLENCNMSSVHIQHPWLSVFNKNITNKCLNQTFDKLILF